MLEVILISGWGLGSDLWTRVMLCLKSYSWLKRVSVLELGIAQNFVPVARNRLIVAHSMGVLWCLRQRPFVWDGFISVNGFTRFIVGVDFPEGIEKRILKRMLYQLNHDPIAVHTTFLQRCGVRMISPLRRPEYLEQELMWLLDWDVRNNLTSTDPFLVLASCDDPIISPAMTRACFRSLDNIRVIWHPNGGHILPLSHPKWLAMYIGAFAWYLLLPKFRNCCIKS